VGAGKAALLFWRRRLEERLGLGGHLLASGRGQVDGREGDLRGRGVVEKGLLLGDKGFTQDSSVRL
jgi:hypothetical protein